MADIMATGNMGLAFEATAGTYVAPTKFFPIRSENLKYVQDTQWREVIRGLADSIGAVQGTSHIEGDVVIELLPDVLPYFLYASRNTIVKTGAGPYVYTCTPFHGANPTAARTLSLAVTRNGLCFGYVGCVVSSMKFTVDNGVLLATLSIIGRDEATQTLPTATFANQVPFGHGMYSIEFPTATPLLDVVSFDCTINDNASPEYRLSTTRAPQFVRFGARDVEFNASRDFSTRAEYDAFKALTVQSITAKATNGASAIFALKLAGSIKDTYEISGLANQGDLVSADIKFQGVYDTGTSKAYEIIVTTTETIT